MSFYNNAYYPFGVGSPGGYSPPGVTPLPYTPQQNVPATPQSNGNAIIWVQGEAGAKSYLVAPNSAVLLMDSDAMRFYMKSADASGIPSLRIFEYNEVLPSGNQPITAAKENNLYVTREEHQRQYDELSQKIDRMLADTPKKPQRKAAGGGEDE